jgi:glycosyltransferase involved in cell wall biosynthesis
VHATAPAASATDRTSAGPLLIGPNTIDQGRSGSGSVRLVIVAIIPAHDESPRIAAVTHGAATHLPVLVVDDGSTDDTAAVAQAAGATILPLRPNQGKGAALRAGFRWALDHGFYAALTLDADGQHDPAEIPAFLEARARTGAELVIGRRDLRRMPPIRRLSNLVGGLAVSWAVGRSIPDNQSGYRLVGHRLMEAMVASGESGFEFEVEMIARAVGAGWAIEWIPIRTIYAGEPSHIRPWRHFTSFIRVVRAARATVRRART